MPKLYPCIEKYIFPVFYTLLSIYLNPFDHKNRIQNPHNLHGIPPDFLCRIQLYDDIAAAASCNNIVIHEE